MRSRIQPTLLWTALASLLLGSFLAGATERGIGLRARARQDGPRIAFLIANQGYDVGPLTYPFQDVGLLEPALDSAKFSIIRVFRDVRTRADFERVSTELRKVLKKHPGAVVFFYYSGHAIQIQKANYLVPTGAIQWQDIEAAMAGSYKLQNFLNVMGEYSARLQLIFLDACRNNPYLDRIPKIDRPQTPPGLASERFTRPAHRRQAWGIQLYYRVSPGKTAPDDGQFAASLAQWMKKPGAEVASLLKEVGPSLSDGGEPPWAEGYVEGDFYFQAPEDTPVPTPAPGPPAMDTSGAPPSPTPVVRRFRAVDPATARRAQRPIMVSLPGGTFLMGDDGSNQSDEKPAHKVRVQAFQLSQTEVTVAQYRACVVSGDCALPKRKTQNEYCNWGHDGREDHPINCIRWEDAQRYMTWLGEGARLPTEAEWEYSAKATGTRFGAERPYPWGLEKPSCKRAVFDPPEDVGDGCGEDRTWPVCSKSPIGDTPEGVCDMAGNVWEWVEDWYDADYYKTSPQDDPTGAEGGSDRVVRGGSWDYSASWVRSAVRDRRGPGSRFNNLGFRVVVSGPTARK